MNATFPIIMPPTLEKLKGHVALGFVNLSIENLNKDT